MAGIMRGYVAFGLRISGQLKVQDSGVREWKCSVGNMTNKDPHVKSGCLQ